MKMLKVGIFMALSTVMLLLPLTASAQSSVGAANSGFDAGGQANQNTTNEQGEQSPTATHQNPPLVGAKEYSPGSTEPTPSYLIPSFQWTSFANSNGGYLSSQQEPGFQGYALGSLTLQSRARNTQFNLDYAGGALLNSQNVDPAAPVSRFSYGTYHQVGISESVTLQRWELFLSENASYLPESPSGFTGFGGLQSFNGGLGGAVYSTAGSLNPLVQSVQSIDTYSRRVSNTSIAQAEYRISPRTTFSVTATYDILHFFESGLDIALRGRYLDSNGTQVFAGLTHALDPHNNIGITYVQHQFHFSGGVQDYEERGALLSYGRRVLGKLSFELSAGPAGLQYANSTNGSLPGLSWMTVDSIDYVVGKRANLGASFQRMAGAGSGLLPGAETYMVDAHIDRQLSRKSHLELSFNYYRNQSLGYPSTGTNRPTWEWRGGGITFSRELGPFVSFYILYNVQSQDTSADLCVSNRCGTTFFRQIGGIGFNWHTRPIRLQ